MLRHLSDALGHSMGEIAEQLEMNPPTLTKLIDRMVGKSLVQRAADPEDSRRVLVYAPTPGWRCCRNCSSASTATRPRSAACWANATRASWHDCSRC